MFKLIKSLYTTARLFYAVTLIALLFLISNWVEGLFAITWLLVFLLFLLILMEAIMLFKNSAFKATRILPEKFSNSDENEVFLKIENHYSFLIYINLIDELPVQFQKRDFLIKTQAKAQDKKTLSYIVKPVDRGEYIFGNLNCFVSSPIRLISRRFIFNKEQMVKVYPSFIQMKRYDFLAIDNRLTFQGLKKIRKIGNTLEFEQIKEYVSGDDVRTVNWKATAKKAQLMVNQYQDEKMQPIYSIIDTSRVMKMPFKELKLLDYAINSALAFSNIALKKGDKVGLIEFSNKVKSFVQAEAKKTHLNTVLESLYNINTHYLDSDFGTLQLQIKRYVNHRSLLLLFTNFEHISALHRQMPYLLSISKKHLLVVVFFENTELKKLTDQPASTIPQIYDQTIAQQFQYDKKVMVNELQKRGIQTILTTPENLTVSTINKYLEIKAKGLL